LEGATQQNLLITDESEPTVTVDNIEVGQFIYLMLNNQKVRDVIDTITSKAVLILGRFTDERKAVLDALREELRKRISVGEQKAKRSAAGCSLLVKGKRGPITENTGSKPKLHLCA
jgi:hypothetical protein